MNKHLRNILIGFVLGALLFGIPWYLIGLVYYWGTPPSFFSPVMLIGGVLGGVGSWLGGWRFGRPVIGGIVGLGVLAPWLILGSSLGSLVLGLVVLALFFVIARRS